MADINVFELTNMALKNLDTDKKAAKKSVSESVKRTSKKRTMKENKRVPKISFKKLKLESLKTMTEDEDFDFTPDDEVVLVIDTEMEEVPESEEDAVAAAQELVGDTVCKCSVCGANYICTDNVIEEDVDGEVTMVAEEGVCPICGEEAPQIVVGEIVADVEEPVEDKEPETDDEEVEETETETETEDGDEEFDETEFTVDEEEEVEEGCNRKRRPAKRENMRKSMTRRPTMRRESMRKPMKRPTRPAARMESAERNVRPSVRRPATRRTAESAMNRTARPARRPMSRRTAESAVKRPVRRPINRTSRMAMENRKRTSGVAYNFNEVALNKLFTKFATENYSNVKTVRFTKGSLNKNGNMTLEGVVTTVKGNKRPIKLVAEGIKNVKNGTAMLKVRENGPFTEATVKTRNRVPFVVECAVKGNTVTPVSMKYAFTTTESGLKESKGRKGSYKVFGSVK